MDPAKDGAERDPKKMGRAAPNVEVSVHRFERGKRLPLGAQRLGLSELCFNTIHDEEQIELLASDGGSVWAVGAGPEGWGRDTDLADLDVGVSAEIARVLHEYAKLGDFTLALWRAAESHVYAWDPVAMRHRNPDEVVRSVPEATFVTSTDLASQVTADWPAAVVVNEPGDLLDRLLFHAT